MPMESTRFELLQSSFGESQRSPHLAAMGTKGPKPSSDVSTSITGNTGIRVNKCPKQKAHGINEIEPYPPFTPFPLTSSLHRRMKGASSLGVPPANSLELATGVRVNFGGWAGHRSPVEWSVSRSASWSPVSAGPEVDYARLSGSRSVHRTEHVTT